MPNRNTNVLGLEIGLNNIYFSVFSCDCHLLKRKKITSPYPLMPGAVTVEICQGVNFLDPERIVGSIGILLPQKSETTRRIVNKFFRLPYWNNVPLVDWLEIRLKRKIFIVNPFESYFQDSFSERFHDCNEISFRRSFFAAFIASQKFESIDYLVRKE